MNKKQSMIYLIDANSLCYRAFYAIQALSTSKGFPTNAIYGFINMLRKIMREYNPERMVMVFDMAGPTKRHEKYEEYKEHRTPTPDDLIVQMDRIKGVIEAYNIPICQLKGYEADDIIATIAEKAKKKGFGVTIVSGDKDALQLIDGVVNVLSPHTAGDKLYEAKDVKEKYGVLPEKMVELMAFIGDASDNIPGVKGIGKVTAEKLITQYGSVENVYKNIDKISSESTKKKLIEGKEIAHLSRELVELQRDVPIKMDLKDIIVGEPDTEKLAELFKEFEFGKLLREIVPQEQEEEKGQYSVLNSPEDLEKASKAIKAKKETAFFVDISADDGTPRGIAFSWQGKKSVYIPFETDKKSLDMLKDILEDSKVKKIGYDIKEEKISLGKIGIMLQGDIFDVFVADYLIDPSRTSSGIEAISMRKLGYNLPELKGGVHWNTDGQGEIGFSDVSMAPVFCERADIILRMYEKLQGEMKEKHLSSLFEDVEMPLVSVLAEMEEEGVGIDTKYLADKSVVIGKRIDEVTKDIYRLAGEEFNVNSPKQLQVILYDKLGLPTMKKTKTGFSTDESVLRRLADMHDLPKELLEYREINKLKTGYYDSILALTNKKEGRLHARFNQAVTATGRLSSSEPNLQNVPIKTPLGKEIRRAFVPGKKGGIILAADYSQIELRILAHLSKDKKLIEAFKGEEDVHRFTASLIFDCKIKDVTDEMRSAAKTVNFGIVYGMSAFGLAKDLDISVGEAQEFIDAYFKRYSGVKKFIDNTIDEAKSKGYVTTLLNRRRYIPEINSRNEHVKGFAERIAVNTPVQGSAADLIKLAMIECSREFRGTDIKMIIQVHDELVFELPEKKLKKSAEKIKEIMEKVMDLKVPLKVDIEAGKNWLDMEEV